MKTSDFDYYLPPELIAQQPTKERNQSRMLEVLGSAGLRDLSIRDLPDLLDAGDLMVVNDTKVIPARLQARKKTGARLEVMLERILSKNCFSAQIRANRAPKPGAEIVVQGRDAEQSSLKVVDRQGVFYTLELQADVDVVDWFHQVGSTPLPPYIERETTVKDMERYQTVYAKRVGAVAAPTAGLHIDQELLEILKAKHIGIASITLHVGAGTYQPVRVERVDQHRMHAEWIEVNAEVCDKINQVKKNGGRVLAVGTTVVRALESAAKHSDDELRPFCGDSKLFITPGFEFKVVDDLLTNFHLPRSTLLMMVSAFIGKENLLLAYQHAINAEYRFFSYGDCMFIRP